MKACLHLYTKNSQDSVFYQILSHDIDLNEGESFEYTEAYYNQLDNKTQDLFKRFGLDLGSYFVIATNVEGNDYWGPIRYLFLRPAF